MEQPKKCQSYYVIELELTRTHVHKLKYLKRDLDVDVRHRLDQALRVCGYKDPRPAAGKKPDGLNGIGASYPKKRVAELTVPVDGFADPGFRPGALLDALRTEFGEVVKGDIAFVRKTVEVEA